MRDGWSLFYATSNSESLSRVENSRQPPANSRREEELQNSEEPLLILPHLSPSQSLSRPSEFSAHRTYLYVMIIPASQRSPTNTLFLLSYTRHPLRRRCRQDQPLPQQSPPSSWPRDGTHDCQISQCNIFNALRSRVERRRPKPKTQRRAEYYQNLIERHGNPTTVIQNRYADATKDNLSSIRGKFIR